MKHFKNREFSLFNYMCDILYDFYERNDLEHMCALDSLAVGNYKDTKHYLFLQRFCDVWDRVEQREVNNNLKEKNNVRYN